VKQAVVRSTPSHLGSRTLWLIAAALVLLAVATWLPRLTLPRNTFNYIVTIDITQSMEVEDVRLGQATVSRLEAARAALRTALGRLPCGSTIGWSVFTGQRSLLLLPPLEVCSHYDALLASLASINPGMRWANASSIAQGGIFSAVNMAVRAGHDDAVVFITDGQEAPPRLPSDYSVRDVTRGEAGGLLIGVGGEQPEPIPKTDINGKRIGYWAPGDVIQVSPVTDANTALQSHEELSGLRGDYLAGVAAQIGFGYRRLDTPDSLSTALLEPRLAHRKPVSTDLRRWPALAALLLLVWCFLPGRQTRRGRRSGRG
jgi:mxaL protein